MLKQVIAIAFIFVCTSVAWIMLGATVTIRTSEQEAHSAEAVGTLWGGPQVQQAPRVDRVDRRLERVLRQEEGRDVVQTVERQTSTPVQLSSTDIDARFELEHRRKGLLWHATYRVDFTGRYAVRNPSAVPMDVLLRLGLPSGAQMLDDMRFQVDGQEVDLPVQDSEVTHRASIPPNASLRFAVSYRTQGMGEWRYSFGDRATAIRDFRLTMQTDFAQVDFPDRSLSPTHKERTEKGWLMNWNYDRLVADANLGVVMPQKLNPGPWVSRVTFFAPVSLFLFFFTLFILSIIRGVRLHPMHYFFLAAAFFSFHLLLAYLVDHLSVAVAVVVASVVSMALVTSYVRLAVGRRFAFVETGLAQLVYLVGFAYTFFLEGYTGLTVTILSILTLFIVMQVTGRTDWEEVFRSTPPRTAAPQVAAS